MEHHTFSSLGFAGIKNIAVMKRDPVTGLVLPAEVNKLDAPVYKSMLIPHLVRFIQQADLTRRNVGFVAAMAYFMDGHVEYAHNDSDSRKYIVTGGNIAADFYKSDKCPMAFSGNAEFVSWACLQQHPGGLMLYQEIPGDANRYLFRIVHDKVHDDGHGVFSERAKIIPYKRTKDRRENT